MNEQDKDSLRKQAEEIIRLNRQREDEERHVQSLQELVEELQVYQAELEIQNQQLRDTQTALEQERLKYFSLFQGLPLPAFVLDKQGIIEDLNQSALTLLHDRQRHHLIGTAFHRLMDQSGKSWLYQLLHNAAQVQTTQSKEIALSASDNRHFTVLLRPVSPLQGDTGQFIVILQEPSPVA